MRYTKTLNSAPSRIGAFLALAVPCQANDHSVVTTSVDRAPRPSCVVVVLHCFAQARSHKAHFRSSFPSNRDRYSEESMNADRPRHCERSCKSNCSSCAYDATVVHCPVLTEIHFSAGALSPWPTFVVDCQRAHTHQTVHLHCGTGHYCRVVQRSLCPLATAH